MSLLGCKSDSPDAGGDVLLNIPMRDTCTRDLNTLQNGIWKTHELSSDCWWVLEMSYEEDTE